MKYIHGFFGAIYGTVISYLMLAILIPVFLLILVVKEYIINVSENPIIMINPIIYLGLVILLPSIAILSLFSPIVLGCSIGKNTAIACYNHGWQGWLSPFKYIRLVISDEEKYDEESIQNITGFTHDEKSKIAETTISTHAIKVNHIIKQSIDSSLRKRSTEGNKSMPMEISAIITAYSMEEYKKHYDNGDILIEKQEVANIAEKTLNKYIHQSHTTSWSTRFFSCVKKCCNLTHNNSLSVSPLR
jgi:hypothetical protein